MHTRTKHAAESILTVFLLGISISASATVIEEITVTHTAAHQSADRNGEPWSGADRRELAAHLELSKEQRQEVSAIFADVRPELADLRKQRRSNRDALGAMEVFFNRDVVALERLTSDRTQLLVSTDDVRERIRAELDDVLTQAQQIRLVGLLEANQAPVLDSSTVQIGADAINAD